MNIIDYLFGFPVSGCDVVQGQLYVLVFNGCQRFLTPYNNVVGGGVNIRDEGNIVQLSATDINFMGDCIQAQYNLVTHQVDVEVDIDGHFDCIDGILYLCGNAIDMSCLLTPPCVPVPIEFVGGYLVLNAGTDCETSVAMASSVKFPAVPSHELLINIHDPEIPGYQYAHFADAYAFIMSVGAPTANDTWTIRFTGVHNEDIVLHEWVTLCGDDPATSILKGKIAIEKTGTGLPFISNNIKNCTIHNFIIDQLSSDINVITGAIGYTADTYYYMFNTTPSTGTYDIIINGITLHVNYNDDAATIQTALQGIDPSLGDVVVSGDYTTAFTIYLYGLPAQQNTVTTVDNTGMGMNGRYTFGYIPSQTFCFGGVPLGGTRVFTFDFDGNTYTSNTLDWDISRFDLQTEIAVILTDVQSDTGIDLGIGSSTVQLLHGPGSRCYVITFPNAGYDMNSFDVNNLDVDLVGRTRKSGYKIFMDNVRLISAKIKGGANGIKMKNSFIQDGERRFFENFCELVTTQVLVTSFLGNIYPYSLNARHVLFNDPEKTMLTFQGGTFEHCMVIGFLNIAFGEGQFKFYHTTLNIDKGFSVIGGSTWDFYNGSIIGGKMSINPNAIVHTRSTNLSEKPAVSGLWYNHGDSYDPDNMGILDPAIQTVQLGIDNLSAWIGPITYPGNPNGNVDARFVGDRCLDTVGTTVYTAFALGNSDWY